MISPARAMVPRTAAVVLLLAVLSGLVGMHQLPGHHGSVAVSSAGHVDHERGCGHNDEPSGEHRQACESRVVQSGGAGFPFWALPAVLPIPASEVPLDSTAVAFAATSVERAPPNLHQLSILRI